MHTNYGEHGSKITLDCANLRIAIATQCHMALGQSRPLQPLRTIEKSGGMVSPLTVKLLRQLAVALHIVTLRRTWSQSRMARTGS